MGSVAPIHGRSKVPSPNMSVPAQAKECHRQTPILRCSSIRLPRTSRSGSYTLNDSGSGESSPLNRMGSVTAGKKSSLNPNPPAMVGPAARTSAIGCRAERTSAAVARLPCDLDGQGSEPAHDRPFIGHAECERRGPERIALDRARERPWRAPVARRHTAVRRGPADARRRTRRGGPAGRDVRS